MKTGYFGRRSETENNRFTLGRPEIDVCLNKCFIRISLFKRKSQLTEDHPAKNSRAAGHELSPFETRRAVGACSGVLFEERRQRLGSQGASKSLM